MILLELVQVAQAAAEQAPAAGPIIAGAASLGVGGAAAVRYFFNRFERLEDQMAETREDLAAIMGHLNIERPNTRPRFTHTKA